MEVKEIDGKQYVEFDVAKHARKRFITSVVILILLAASILALVSATVILVKNKNIIASDPLIYGMSLHNFTSCSCFDQAGTEWSSTDKGFLNIPKGGVWIDDPTHGGIEIGAG